MININPAIPLREGGHLERASTSQSLYRDPGSDFNTEDYWVLPNEDDVEYFYPARQEPLRCIIREWDNHNSEDRLSTRCFGIYFFDLENEVFFIDMNEFEYDHDGEITIQEYWEFVDRSMAVDLGEEEILTLLNYVAELYIRNLAVYKRRPKNVD